MRNAVRSSMVSGAWMALALLAAFSVAKATSGRISFSGAVVEPTCAIAELSTDIVTQAVSDDAPRRLTCGQTANDPGRAYSRVVVDLDAARVADDRLLSYMIRRTPAAATGAPPFKLVVRTYD